LKSSSFEKGKDGAGPNLVKRVDFERIACLSFTAVAQESWSFGVRGPHLPSCLSQALFQWPAKSSSGPRTRFTRPLPFSNRLGRSAIGTPDFCMARTRLPTTGFSVTGTREIQVTGCEYLWLLAHVTVTEPGENQTCVGMVDRGDPSQQAE
jgi:hypothetical protein